MALVKGNVATRGNVTWGLDKEVTTVKEFSDGSKWPGSGPSVEGVSMTSHGPDGPGHSSEVTHYSASDELPGDWDLRSLVGLMPPLPH